ncbi:MAG TPA: hypothetical protein VMT55_02785, partial [Candidatus Sulfotelmatobacter sp.]|nr:hypothetical protein [Candidatus Sulfotelmatobacter sp.]
MIFFFFLFIFIGAPSDQISTEADDEERPEKMPAEPAHRENGIEQSEAADKYQNDTENPPALFPA